MKTFLALPAVAYGATSGAELFGTPSLDSILSSKASADNADKHVVQAEMQKLGLYQESIDAKMGELSGDKDFRKKIENLNIHKSNEQWHKQLSEIQKKAEHRRRTLKTSDAVKVLESKLSSSQRAEISSLLQRKEQFMTTGRLAADDKAMFVRAMTTLNDMYLSIDDERINTLTTCTVTLFDMYRKVFFHWDTVRDLESMMGESYADMMKAGDGWWASRMDKYHQEEILRGVKAEQNVRMQELDEDLEKKESDVALFKFIIGHVGAKCAEGDLGSGPSKAPALLQEKHQGAKSFTDMTSAEKARCSKVCAQKADDPVSRNAVLLKAFSDPAVMAKAEQTLSKHAKISLKETMKNLRAAEAEEVHPKYQSFLQKSSVDQQPQKWQIVDQAYCGCGTLEDAGCPALLTLIGQELECAKQIVREQEATIRDQEAKDKDEREEINTAIAQLDSAIAQYINLTFKGYNEMKKYRMMIWQEMTTTWEFWHETEEERFKCYLKLSELEANSFCAIKHIREFMKGLALEALGLQEEQVQDCIYADFMRETGECQDAKGAFVPCIEGGVIPSDPEKLPQALWTRDLVRPQYQDPAVEEAIGTNTTLAMGCPATKELYMKCNTFLCPLDCETSEMSDWSKCTSECDGGFQTRTSEVVRMSRNGGAACPETAESRECNTHSCDVDCVLHEVWSATPEGCLKACTTGDEPRIELLRKHIKEEAVGKGACPEKNNEARVIESGCEPRTCRGDEVCADTMDLVITYECSTSVTQLGCWFMASFVVSLLERMPTSTYGFPTLKLGLVKFGNGISLPVPNVPDTYYVADAHALSTLSDNAEALIGQLYGDVMKLWTVGNSADSIGQESRGGETWQLGYNNLGQALKKSQELLDMSDRVEGDVVALQKVLVLTKGKRAGCTIAKEVASDMKEKGIIIDMILFAADYETNPDPYEVLQEVVSFPFHQHLHSVPGLHTLASFSSRHDTVARMIPSICPDAVSPGAAIQKQCNSRTLLLHRGRTCGDWTYKLSEEPVPLEKCANLAMEGGFKSFVHTDVEHPNYIAEEGGATPNCFTHKKDGKKAAFDPVTKLPTEDTCNYVPDFGKGNEANYEGWLHQDLAAGNGELTSHYAVLGSKSECPRPWDFKYKKTVFGEKYDPQQYFIK